MSFVSHGVFLVSSWGGRGTVFFGLPFGCFCCTGKPDTVSLSFGKFSLFLIVCVGLALKSASPPCSRRVL